MFLQPSKCLFCTNVFPVTWSGSSPGVWFAYCLVWTLCLDQFHVYTSCLTTNKSWIEILSLPLPEFLIVFQCSHWSCLQLLPSSYCFYTDSAVLYMENLCLVPMVLTARSYWLLYWLYRQDVCHLLCLCALCWACISTCPFWLHILASCSMQVCSNACFWRMAA